MNYNKTISDNLDDRWKHISDELDIDNEKRRGRTLSEREKRAFDKLPDHTIIEFWSQEAGDFVAPAYKVWIEYFDIGYWQSFCPVTGNLVYRHITEKGDDPYYEYSDKIRFQRSTFHDDLLQPDDYGFGSLYGDPFERNYRLFQQKQEDIHNKYASLGLRGLLDETNELQDIERGFSS